MRKQWSWRGTWLSSKDAATKPDSLIIEQFDSRGSHGRRRDNSHILFSDLHMFSVPRKCVCVCAHECMCTHTQISYR